jgi:hypothetical protein
MSKLVTNTGYEIEFIASDRNGVHAQVRFIAPPSAPPRKKVTLCYPCHDLSLSVRQCRKLARWLLVASGVPPAQAEVNCQ